VRQPENRLRYRVAVFVPAHQAAGGGRLGGAGEDRRSGDFG
jgi:hypothetical protein